MRRSGGHGWTGRLYTALTRRRLVAAGVALAALLVGAGLFQLMTRPTAAQVGEMPPLPGRWPTTTLALGMSDGAGGAAQMRETAPFELRYQYLAGGANTGNGWSVWVPDGRFVTEYIHESEQHGLTPVFTYYMLTQSLPGNGSGPNEAQAVEANVANVGTMRAYFEDLRLFFIRAGEHPDTRVILHVEPDLWGFLHQQTREDDAAEVRVAVSATGLPELAGLPDDLRGFARAFVQLRDAHAPNVLLGYHVSVWGTGTDPFLNNARDAVVDVQATRAAIFYRSLGASFDLTFAEFSDRDAAFKQHVYGDGGRSWWDAADFTRHVRFLAMYVDLTGKRVILWQIPYGNTKMRAMNNSWNHFQDNRVEWLLDDPSRDHLGQYLNAGVIALLFGRGADGATDASDANGDGVTDPAPIGGNTRPSLSADDDGGFFRERAAAYYEAGALALP